jgi:hypothetical protein
MRGLFYVRSQGRLNRIHQCDVPDGMEIVALRGIRLDLSVPGGHEPPAGTPNEVVMRFRKVRGSDIDGECIFLYDADEELLKTSP